MPHNGVRTEPENHVLYYVEYSTGMVYLTHYLRAGHRLIETWYHEDFAGWVDENKESTP